MALSLLPQPKSVKVLSGAFDFKEVDTIYLSKKAKPTTKRVVEHLAHEFKTHFHLDYKIKPSSRVKDPHGCLITHHTREGIFVRTEMEKEGGYDLLAAGHSLTISAADSNGLHSATRTIRELLLEGTRIPALKIKDWPTMPFRALHLDFSGMLPNEEAQKEFLARASLHKYNAVLVQYGASFPFRFLQDEAEESGVTLEILKEFQEEAHNLGLQVIPLFPVDGSWEFLLERDEYKAFRRISGDARFLDYSNPKAQKLAKELLKELLEAHKYSESVHLGGLAFEPKVQASLDDHGEKADKVELKSYLDPLLKAIRQVKLADRGAFIWDTALAKLTPDLFKKIPKSTGIVCHSNEPADGQFRWDLVPDLKTFTESGHKVYGACAVRGAGPFYSNVPNYRQRMDNIDWWVDGAETQKCIEGIFVMGVSRFSPTLTPCEPLPTMWPSAMYAAERSWAGLGSSRESFERRMLVEFYGLRPELTDVSKAHYSVSENGSSNAKEIFRAAKKSARRGQDVLELLELMAGLESLNHERRRLLERVGASLPQLEAGKADPVEVQALRARVPALNRQIEYLHRDLSRVLLKRFQKTDVEAFVRNRLLLCERFLAQLQTLLRRN